MVPMWNGSLDGFLNLLVEDLTAKHVCGNTVKTAFANVGKDDLKQLLRMGEVKFNKTEKKDGLLGIAHRSWNNILAEIHAMMGTDEVFDMETPHDSICKRSVRGPSCNWFKLILKRQLVKVQGLTKKMKHISSMGLR